MLSLQISRLLRASTLALLALVILPAIASSTATTALARDSRRYDNDGKDHYKQSKKSSKKKYKYDDDDRFRSRSRNDRSNWRDNQRDNRRWQPRKYNWNNHHRFVRAPKKHRR